jgi:PAS domain S-box-containing protein
MGDYSFANGLSSEEDSTLNNEKIPFLFRIVISLCIGFPIVLQYFLRSQTPITIFLLLLVPVVIFTFYQSIKRVLFSTFLLSLFHISWGVFYQLVLGSSVHHRIYNHLGLTLISFALAIIIATLNKELKEIAHRYRSIVDHSPQMIVIHRKGKIMYCNPTAVQLAGVKQASDLIGISIFDFVHISNKEKAMNRNRKVIENQRGVAFIEYKMVR